MLIISYRVTLSFFLPFSLSFWFYFFYGNWNRVLQITRVVASSVAESKTNDCVNVFDAFKFMEHTGTKSLLV